MDMAPPVFQNDANAVARWLSTEGFDVEDVSATLVKTGSRLHVEFDADVANATDEELRAFLDDAPYVEWYRDESRVRPVHLRLLLELEAIRDGDLCDHRRCDEPATTYFVMSEEIIPPRRYCIDHTAGAMRLFRDDEVGDGVDERPRK